MAFLGSLCTFDRITMYDVGNGQTQDVPEV
jgi:hypothetical protein